MLIALVLSNMKQVHRELRRFISIFLSTGNSENRFINRFERSSVTRVVLDCLLTGDHDLRENTVSNNRFSVVGLNRIEKRVLTEVGSE